MSDDKQNHKEQYAKSVCFFLAELLRTRKIDLKRAAEIAQKVMDNINLIDTEQDFSRLIKGMSADFEELFQLEERLQLNISFNERRDLDDLVREFVASILPQDTNLAFVVLQEAVKDNVQSEDLCVKFPQFREFILKTHESR